jgi:hypothetical protein
MFCNIQIISFDPFLYILNLHKDLDSFSRKSSDVEFSTFKLCISIPTPIHGIWLGRLIQVCYKPLIARPHLGIAHAHLGMIDFEARDSSSAATTGIWRKYWWVWHISNGGAQQESWFIFSCMQTHVHIWYYYPLKIIWYYHIYICSHLRVHHICGSTHI